MWRNSRWLLPTCGCDERLCSTIVVRLPTSGRLDGDLVALLLGNPCNSVAVNGAVLLLSLTFFCGGRPDEGAVYCNRWFGV